MMCSLALRLALLCILKMPTVPGFIAAMIVILTGVIISRTVFWINRMFRDRVLQITRIDSAPDLNQHAPMLRRVSADLESAGQVEACTC